MARARILVIEDDRFYREFYHDVLEKEGFQVQVAHSGREALRILDGGGFDLVISDLVVQGTSGLELLPEIKSSHPSLDVIMVTSMQSLRKAVEALKLGASDYLTKPVDKDELLVSIAKILERQVVIQEHSKLISENIHFYELLRIQKRMLHLLATLDVERLQDSILDALIQELGAVGAFLFLRDDKGRYPVAASRGVFSTADGAAELTFPSGGLKESLEGGRALLESSSGEQWVAGQGDEGQRLLLPVRFRGETIAAVRLLPRSGERHYGAFDIEVGRHLLEAGGLALRNALDVRRTVRGRFEGSAPGTFDPSYFHSFSELQLAVARRYNRETAVLLVKVENLAAIRSRFKDGQVREVLGHLTRHLLEVIRETDLLSLLEDDLFGIVVPETDFYGALMLKKRIRSKIARATYPLDMKRDMVPLLSIGTAACPDDGGHYASLLETARRRLERERESAFNILHPDGMDFWSLVALLMERSTMERIKASGPPRASTFHPLAVTEEGTQLLFRSLLKDLSVFYTSRGIFYLGVGAVESQSPYYAALGPKDSLTVSVFALGAKGESLWNLPAVTPVFVSDTQLAAHVLALGITEHYSYGLFLARQDGGGLRGFHTSDDLLVMELVSRLQEKYLLQRRIA